MANVKQFESLPKYSQIYLQKPLHYYITHIQYLSKFNYMA